jgi:CheY-like chemotaxis protein
MLCLGEDMPRKKILAVDDSETVLMVEKTILGPTFDIVTAASGEESIGRARVESPDLVLMDFEMPGISGAETCRRLRAEPRLRTTPIILVTSHSEADCLEDAFLSGFTDFVIKPIDGDELLLKVRGYLDE